MAAVESMLGASCNIAFQPNVYTNSSGMHKLGHVATSMLALAGATKDEKATFLSEISLPLP